MAANGGEAMPGGLLGFCAAVAVGFAALVLVFVLAELFASTGND